MKTQIVKDIKKLFTGLIPGLTFGYISGYIFESIKGSSLHRFILGLILSAIFLGLSIFFIFKGLTKDNYYKTADSNSNIGIGAMVKEDLGMLNKSIK